MGNNGGTSKPFQSNCQANTHDVGEVVNLDDIIDYTVMNHDVGIAEDNDDIKDDFKSGLPYLPCCKPTNEESGLLPHFFMTS
ncbi:MAG: hypothetical protein ACEQSA_07000, partial [Weeksellaceae bacterium]